MKIRRIAVAMNIIWWIFLAIMWEVNPHIVNPILSGIADLIVFAITIGLWGLLLFVLPIEKFFK